LSLRLFVACARKCWSQAFLFKTIGVSSEQQARNRRDIEGILEATLGEVIDSFIPWKQISRAYFHARETPARPPSPVEAPAPAPAPPVTFGENEVREFESEAESSSDEEYERPRVQLGEDVSLDDDDVESDGGDSTDTEAELEKKAGGEVALNM
jgi:hypothetical protein